MRCAPDRPATRGFSLIELLVVVGVIGMIIAMILPAAQNARETARRVRCGNNLRQLGQALHNYLDSHKVFPSGYVSETADGKELGPGWAWGAQMLPELEQSMLATAIDFRLPVEHPTNQRARTVEMSVFLCPTSVGKGPVTVWDDSKRLRQTDLAAAQYVGSAGPLERVDPASGPLGVFFRNSQIDPEQVGDGMSHTIFVGERSRNLADATWSGVPVGGLLCTNPGWTTRSCTDSSALVLAHTGADSNRPDGFASLHPGGGQFAFGDGSVRFLMDSIDPRILDALATRDGGEVVEGE